MTLVQLAGMLPRDPLFREWVGGFVNGDPVSVDEAAKFVRIVCKVESRRDLATSVDAADRFHHFLRQPFLDWRDKQQNRGNSMPSDRHPEHRAARTSLRRPGNFNAQFDDEERVSHEPKRNRLARGFV
ncbi:hypothetical protein [Burkholderia multivorans]|uniref:hypothetical protein n=1 Tax=Burkholderia multivorans TaxID=87883 RepID=UPI0021BEA8DD|nr:hypothetical protein [Burkholderia multivorans]